MTFVEKLAILIERRGWNVPRLLDRLRRDGLDVSRSTVYRWVNGERPPDIYDVRSLARVLEVPLNALIYDEIDLPPADSTRAEMERWVRYTIDRIGLETAEDLLMAPLKKGDRDGSGPIEPEKPNATESVNDTDPPDTRAPGRRRG